MFEIIGEYFSNFIEYLTDDFIPDFLASVFNYSVDMINWATSSIIALVATQLNLEPVLIQFQGPAAWISQRLQLAECLVVFLGAVLTKFVLVKIPYIKW